MSYRGALTHFPCKLRLKFFFTALGGGGGAGAPTAPPGYAYACGGLELGVSSV